MRILTTIVFISLMSFVVSAQNNKTIVGYYPNWQWYDRANLVNPELIYYEKYTIINYAFFSPQSDGNIVSVDAWADEQLLLGPMIWWPDPHNDSTKSLPYLAHQHGVKVLPSIGGWTLSGNFPAIAADPDKRQNFASSCIELIETYHFDGIDLDWEYPGYVPNGGTENDKVNFTLLLEAIREALDELEIQNNQELLLTSCFGAAESYYEHIEWENVLPLVDMVNLMTYDFHGSWDTISNHHTPLYSPEFGNPDWCLDGAFSSLTNEYNVPAGKINMGIAFYGKALANCNQLYGTHTGYDGSTFWEDEGQPLYYNILAKMDQFTNYWDDQVYGPYLLGNSINTFVTYDNPESIALKAEYVVQKGALGVILWEITGDYIETSPGSGQIAGTPLLDTILVVFDEMTTITESGEKPYNLFPNPASKFFTLSLNSEIEIVKIFNLNGKLVHVENSPTNQKRIFIGDFLPGIYVILVRSKDGDYTEKLIVQ